MNDIAIKPTATNIIRYQLISSIVSTPIAMGLAICADVTYTAKLPASSWKDTILFWLALSLAAIVGALLGQLLLLKKSLETLSITISDRTIIGPGSWIWQRKILELEKLDKTRSSHRNLYQQLFRLRNLWFRNGEKITVCEAIYGKEQIQTLLEVLQLKNY